MSDAPRPVLRPLPRMSPWTVLGVAVGVALVLFGGWTALRAQRVLGWGLVAVLLAALAWPLRNLLDRHLPRVLATILSIVMLIVLPVAFLLLAFRDLNNQFDHLRSALIEASRNVEDSGRFSDTAQSFHLTEQVERLLDTMDPIDGGVSEATSLASALVVVTVLTIFLVIDGWGILRNYVRQIPDHAKRLRVGAVMAFAYRRWARYQLCVLAKAVVVGAVVYVIATVCDLPAATVVALVAGVASTIPMVGTAVGSIPLVLLAAGFRSPVTAIVVAALVLALQVADHLVMRRLIEPRAMPVGPIVPVIIALVVGQEFGLGAAVCTIGLATFAMALMEGMQVSRRAGPVA